MGGSFEVREDKVRWVRSPCSPGREGWTATGEKSGEHPLETESVSHRVQREHRCMALCVLVTAQKWLALWTLRWGVGMLEFNLRLRGKVGAKYEDIECQAEELVFEPESCWRVNRHDSMRLVI